MRRIAFVSAIFAVMTSSAAAQDVQDYPNRPVRFISATAPGGAVDVQGRMFAQKLTESAGRPFVIDYKPGAANRIGYLYVAKSPADGYTLLLVNPTFTYGHFLGGPAGYDPIKDFTPIAQLAKAPYVLVVNPAEPIASLREYLDRARANPGKLNAGTVGEGSFYHLAFAWLHSEAKVKVGLIPYKGGAPALVALLGGQLTASFGSPLSVLGHIKSGKLRAIAVTTAERSKILPDVPTIAEQGIASYDLSTWLGLVAPAKTPPQIISKLNSELAIAAKDPKIVATLESDGGTAVGGTTEQFRQLIATELTRWHRVIQDANITAGD